MDRLSEGFGGRDGRGACCPLVDPFRRVWLGRGFEDARWSLVPGGWLFRVDWVLYPLGKGWGAFLVVVVRLR